MCIGLRGQMGRELKICLFLKRVLCCDTQTPSGPLKLANFKLALAALCAQELNSVHDPYYNLC